MDTVMSRTLGALLALTLLRVFPADSQRVEMPKKDLEVIKGQMVVLEAWYTPTSAIEKNIIIWNFMANDSKQIISYTSGQTGMGSPEFRSRVGFVASMPSANLSIYINSTEETDSGRYLCNVIVPGAPGLSGELRLNVKVPPSTPMCSVTGDPVVTGNVTLSCKSNLGKPLPRYRWTKAAPFSAVFFSPAQTCEVTVTTAHAALLSDEQQGSLRLSNLTLGMSGEYVCRASNTAGSASCNIILEVSTPRNTWLIAGAALGSLVGLAALVLFLTFILRRIHDHEEEEMANDIKEDAQAPKRVSWVRSSTGSDIVSKNGTLCSIASSPPPQDPRNTPHSLSPSPPGACDDSSVLTASSSMVPYPGDPEGSNPLHGLPGYNGSKASTLAHLRRPRPHPQPLSSDSGSGPRPGGARPQAPCLALGPAASTALSRVGAVPVTVPSQNQAGSLV
ncbi:endothelial cell-selective adhesion molecule isoform X1 [Electrophorus electricus]|uniref:endothelial cell-selective adhesion molecule isoform X1 n=1 Tax=Electrophorus electricus TaxID=8005 RepID=UPI0015CFAB6E|nr:endothelial cell-selective adhesion molecule isoform X1 [Electrophorus electricus]